MPRRPMLSALPLAVALATGVLTTPAAAAPPDALSGDLSVAEFVVTGGSSPGQGGKVNIFTARSVTLLEGDLAGQAVNLLTCVEVVGRSFTCHGTSDFTGTVEGAPATATSRISFRCSWLEDRCTGRSVLDTGTGALADTRSILTFEQEAFSGEGTYTTRVLGG